MILLFIHSLEFYTLALLAAMAVVGLLMHPASKGEARTFFAKGNISPAESEETGIEAGCNGSGKITFTHKGLYLDTLDCEINYAITVIGKDVKITEKRTDKKMPEVAPAIVDVTFCIDCLGKGRYHLFFESPWSGRWAAGYISTDKAANKRIELHF